MYKINEMYAFVMEDEEKGEGVPAFINSKGVWMPMVGADMDRIEDLIPIAKRISAETGKPFKILKFKDRIDVTEEMLKKFK